MDNKQRCESLLRRAWDLHVKISEMQAARKAQQADTAGTGDTELEQGLEALLLAMENLADGWVRQLWRTLGELERHSQ